MTLHHDLTSYYDDDYLMIADVMTPEAVTENEIGYLVRLLDIIPGQRILDLGCGYGRIAHGLARHGVQVTGVDLVPQMLDLARSRAAADGLEIAYIEGDMAGLKGLSGFDTVIMWYFSFGYGADGGHPKILRAAYNALRRGGVLLFDQYNTHMLAREAYPSLVDRGNTLFIHRPRPELEHGRWGVERIVVTEGAMRRSHFSCRSYTPPELRSMLETAGFQDIRFFGDGREPYTLESRKLVVAARK